MTTHRDYPDIPALQPRRVPTRFARKLERDFAIRAGIDRPTINWGDLVVAVVVVTAICIAIGHMVRA